MRLVTVYHNSLPFFIRYTQQLLRCPTWVPVISNHSQEQKPMPKSSPRRPRTTGPKRNAKAEKFLARPLPTSRVSRSDRLERNRGAFSVHHHHHLLASASASPKTPDPRPPPPPSPSRSRVSDRGGANGGHARPLGLGRPRVRAAAAAADRHAAGATDRDGAPPPRGAAPRRRRDARRRPPRPARGQRAGARLALDVGFGCACGVWF